VHNTSYALVFKNNYTWVKQGKVGPSIDVADFPELNIHGHITDNLPTSKDLKTPQEPHPGFPRIPEAHPTKEELDKKQKEDKKGPFDANPSFP